MNHFERITASPETLGAFLASIPVASSPWDDCFSKTFCATCDREDCDAGPCPHQAERNNPTWWLKQEAEGRPQEAAHRSVTWEDGVSPKIVRRHYGYPDTEIPQTTYHGYWPKGLVMKRITMLPEFIQFTGLEKKKFRLVLDYDPEFPRAMIHIEEGSAGDE